MAELTKDQLAAGVNLAELDTPMFDQAMAVHELTRHTTTFTSSAGVRSRFRSRHAAIRRLAKAIEGLDALELDLIAEQRAKAKPLPHRFELVPR